MTEPVDGCTAAATDPELTPRMVRILADAEIVAQESGQSRVGAEHVAVAMLRDPRAVPTQVAAQLTDVHRIVAALLDVLGSAPYRDETKGPKRS